MEAFNWQTLVNKPVYSSDGKDIGVVREIQPQKIIVSYGPITPDLYAIPKSSMEDFKDGVVYLAETGGYVEHNYKFE
ncbi:MAG TPA: PRC-barrel domain-containing protein [Nitrososphaera sp.]|jgi:hypothetical protein|nr:PRC-barrel domain-containing protein [Nitrososphaera sp.]